MTYTNVFIVLCINRCYNIIIIVHLFTHFTGGPSAPEPDIRVINSSLLVLEWEEPFSWPEYPIDHYTLEVNVDPLNSKIIPKTQTSVLLPRTGELRECRELGFSVRANNGLADSDIGTVQGGFPIGEPMMVHYTMCFVTIARL